MLSRTVRTRHHRRWAGAALMMLMAAATALLTGCAAGFDATSLKPYAPSDGVIGQSGELRALNVLVVAEDGATEGVLVMTLANDGDRPDQLTAIDSDSGTVAFDGPVEIPAGGAVAFGSDTETTATVTGLSAAPGEAIQLELTFSRAEPLRLRTVVMPATGDYASITPPAPTSVS